MALTILDAGIIIAILDSSDVHHAAAREALTLARTQGEELAVPASAYTRAISASIAACSSRSGRQRLCSVGSAVGGSSTWLL